MAVRSLGAFALASACAVSAFQNTSPFFLFSNTDQLQPFDNASPRLLSANTLNSYLKRSLAECAPSGTPHNYIVVHQLGASTCDYQDDKSTPYLSGWLDGSDPQIKQSIVVPEVVGQVYLETIQMTIGEKCKGTFEWINIKDLSDHTAYQTRVSGSPRVITIVFPALPVQDSAEKLAENDAFLSDFIHNHMKDEQWTVIYVTTPRDGLEEVVAQTYEMDEPFLGTTNIELKRDVDSHANEKVLEGGLFEKYMFLSPGLFMGLTAVVPLFLILYVGITALTSLEVSYFAFSKEMGPAGQKKQ
ncbi:uncharacterized protein BDZ99DRAFT_442222 [Mytilinidion resinicola]|uniref:Protein BIG1 n=1 Tax=Mytilinidion resinicola TaxID=574789 RepID=A0A6A6YMV8_9PEZI|nr:uncharacterized protein BDZ99DRAFT_442222 [Mytilinidion resinicola]KAF2809889.1 hypothetical protein BDZ99DRAFT_442222 [Mytilinidion resinicola]